MSCVRAIVTVSGRVQGVWFRQSSKDTATRHGVTGWCRNCPDGSVEALFEGEEEAVNAVVDWCRQGPKAARVERVEVEWQTATGEFNDFSIRG